MSERKAVTKEVVRRYKKASKKGKARILDEFVKTTGYTRVYSSWLLRNYNRRVFLRVNGKFTTYIVGEEIVIKRGKVKKYNEEVYNSLR